MPPRNRDRALLAVARLAWANAALNGGDIGVSINAIEGVKEIEASELRRRITTVRQARRRALLVARWLGTGLIGGQLLLVAALAVFGWVELRRFTHTEILEELRRLAPAAAAALAMVDEVNRDRLDEVADALGRESELHVILLEQDGSTLADSDSESAGALASAQAWPEVIAVRRGAGESWAEHLAPAGVKVLSLARPWRHVDGAEAVLVLSLPRDTLDGPLHADTGGRPGCAPAVLFDLVVRRAACLAPAVNFAGYVLTCTQESSACRLAPVSSFLRRVTDSVQSSQTTKSPPDVGIVFRRSAISVLTNSFVVIRSSTGVRIPPHC